MAAKPKPAKSGAIPNFKPAVTMPTPAIKPGDAGFVGPVAPKAKPTPKTDSAATVDSRVALNKLTSGQTLTAAEREILNLGPIGVNTNTNTNTNTNPVWVKAGTVQTLNGPVDVDANGKAQDGTVPIAVSTGGNTGNTPAGSDKYAGLVSLLSSYGIDKIANMVDKVIADFPEADGDEILNLLRYDSRYNTPYLERFAGNAARLKNKMPLLDEATYLAQEMGYSKVFKSYGLTNLDNRNQYTKLIAADVSIDEATARVSLAYDRVLKADPATRDSFRRFYPMLGNQDLVAAMLDPEEQLPALERKVQTAEIGGAALRQGLTAELMDTTTKSAMYSNVQAGTIGASTIEAAGATPASTVKSYQKIAGELPTMEKLSSIYAPTMEQYGQREAEQAEILGLASAKRKQERLVAREEAQFQGSSGAARGSLGKSRQGQF